MRIDALKGRDLLVELARMRAESVVNRSQLLELRSLCRIKMAEQLVLFSEMGIDTAKIFDLLPLCRIDLSQLTRLCAQFGINTGELACLLA